MPKPNSSIGAACEHIDYFGGENNSLIKFKEKNMAELDKDCIFCKIIRGEIPSKKVYEDEHMLAFYDIEPKAKVHILCVPKVHFAHFDELNSENSKYVAKIIEKLPHIAELGGSANGYRVIVNQGEDAGQTVNHLHFHILGGQTLDW